VTGDGKRLVRCLEVNNHIGHLPSCFFLFFSVRVEPFETLLVLVSSRCRSERFDKLNANGWEEEREEGGLADTSDQAKLLSADSLQERIFPTNATALRLKASRSR
jgi:hypothetical protein